jgi:hypothetical protein
MALLCHNRPDVQIFTRRNVVMGGSLAPYAEHPATTIGDISAIMLSHLPLLGRLTYTPNFKTALLPNFEEKIDKMTRLLPTQDIGLIGGVPTWTVVLFRKILEHTGKQHMLEVWPNLQVYVHGGVSFRPYEAQFRRYIPSDSFIYQEVYNASEGYFAVQDNLDQEGLLLLLKNGIYFEFIPYEEWGRRYPRTVTLSEVEVGANYALVISTNSGLWRYTPGDTVMFTSVKPYRIRVSGRTKQFVNAFGEEVIVDNTDAAIAETCQQTGAVVSEYTVAPVYFVNSEKGGHEWLIEFERTPPDLQHFTTALDLNLQRHNSDYEAKRFKNMALELPRLHVVPKGTFINWMRARGKLGAQAKVPRLANHRTYVEQILEFTGGH